MIVRGFVSLFLHSTIVKCDAHLLSVRVRFDAVREIIVLGQQGMKVRPSEAFQTAFVDIFSIKTSNIHVTVIKDLYSIKVKPW